MSKGSDKRKRKRGEEKAEKHKHTSLLLNSKSGTENAQNAKDSEQRRTYEEEHTMFWNKVKNFLKHSQTTTWLLVIFNGLLAYNAISQSTVMGNQLSTMRKDQRPWIKVSFTATPFHALAPIGGTVHVLNNGKTPARGVVRGEFVIKSVNNGEQPKFDYPLPHTFFTTGMIAPNDTENIPIVRARSGANSSTETDPLTASELDDFNNVKIFFVVYGTVHYADFFGVDHWTKFCDVILPVGPHPSFNYTGQPCTNYGDVDSN